LRSFSIATTLPFTASVTRFALLRNLSIAHVDRVVSLCISPVTRGTSRLSSHTLVTHSQKTPGIPEAFCIRGFAMRVPRGVLLRVEHRRFVGRDRRRALRTPPFKRYDYLHLFTTGAAVLLAVLRHARSVALRAAAL
jgi:hypothetical protein